MYRYVGHNNKPDIIVQEHLTTSSKIITKDHVCEILVYEFPEIHLQDSQTIYTTIECFVLFTKQLIEEGQMNAVKRCFEIAEKMMDEGDKSIRNAIENVYIYSLGPYLAFPTGYQAGEIFNNSLKKEFLRQVHASGI